MVRNKARQPMHISLKLLCASIFVLTAMPRMGLKIGPLPIYVVDILLALTFYYAMQLRSVYRGKVPFSGFVKVILLFAVLAELSAAFHYGSLVKPTYMLVRTLLAVSLFYSVSKIVRSADDFAVVIKAGLLGMIVTSVLMIMTSLPFTRGIATAYVFSNPILEPAAEQTVRMYGDAVDAMRGRSLVGVSILSGAFINILWPLAALLYQWPGVTPLWKRIALAGCVLAPFGVVMSYSRGAILGLFLVVGGVLFFSSGRNRRGIIIAVLSAVTIFGFVGLDSKYFFFDRLENRTRAMVENPYQDERETERLYAYIEPFEHLMYFPQYFFVGEGLSGSKMGGEKAQRLSGIGQTADHAVFAKAYYTYGMIAAFTYVLFLINGLLYLRRRASKRFRSDMLSKRYAQIFLASMLGFVPWFVFGHAAVSTPRGAMMMFFLFGLLAVLKNIEVTQASALTKK